MGVAIGVKHADPAKLDAEFAQICETLAATRPTAVTLFWAIDRMKRLYESLDGKPYEQVRDRLIQEAQQMKLEDIAINQGDGAQRSRSRA